MAGLRGEEEKAMKSNPKDLSSLDLDRMNLLALLKIMRDQEVIDHKTHFDLWRRALFANNTKELGKVIADAKDILRESGKGGLFP